MKKVIKQDDLICGNCAYFCQHYRKTSKGFTAVGCGHCVFPPDQTAGPGPDLPPLAAQNLPLTPRRLSSPRAPKVSTMGRQSTRPPRP